MLTSKFIFYSVAGIIIFLTGIFAFIVRNNFITKILALNIAASGLFMFIIALSYRNPGSVDYVPHALVLTGIVVSVSSTAFALNIIKKLSGSNKKIIFTEEEI